MGERKFCYNCMGNYESPKTVCPHCGYDETTPHNPMYIAPGTILHERYLVGVLLEYNGEGATYVGYDKVISCKVLIREYMPINLCTRVKGKPTISVNYNNLAKYKAFMAEYTELNKSLARLRANASLIQALDMFAENNTTYTVFEYIEGNKLLDYLKDNAGELSWEQVSKLFPPLFTTIGILHNAGMTHRAISPETVYITNKGELKLSGFCISAVRTADAGLEYELFRGYAAPEQYSASSSSRQGSWTDVYSMCALLYRILTGCMPSDSRGRLENDDLCLPHVLNKNIPQHVSRVIMEGMNLSGRDRIQTITELVTKLFEQQISPKPLHLTNGQRNDYSQESYGGGRYEQRNPQPQRRVQQPVEEYYDDDDDDYEYEENYRYEKVNTVDKLKVPVIIGILLLAILMIIAVWFLDIFAGDNDSDVDSSLSSSSSMTDNVVTGTTEPSTEVETEVLDSLMFDLKGKYFEITKDKYKEYFTLEATFEFNDEYQKDQIFEQEIAAGEPFKKGQKINVKVSKGKAVTEIPDYANMTVSQYESLLKQAGIINYSLIAEDTAASGTPNTVIQLQVSGQLVKPGDKFDNTENHSLVVYYLSKDAVIATEPPPTEPPTEAPTEPPTEAPTEAPTDAPTEAPTPAPTEPPAPEQPQENQNQEQQNQEQNQQGQDQNQQNQEQAPQGDQPSQ